jgi:hypothetical protein
MDNAPPINPGPYLICSFIMALLAYRDFHYPFSIGEVRRSTTVRRYAFGLAVYVTGAVAVYNIWVPLFVSVFNAVTDLLPVQFQPSATFGTTVLAVLVLLVLIELPPVRQAIDICRRQAQTLALYPALIERFCTILSNLTPDLDERAAQAVSRELHRFDVTGPELSQPSCLTRALSLAAIAESIHLRAKDLAADEEADQRARTFARTQMLAKGVTRPGYYRYLRHIASAFVALRAIDASSPAGKQAAAAIAAAVEDEGAMMIGRHHRQVAELALSQALARRCQLALFTRFGYRVPPDLSLPFWPIVWSFFLVWGGTLLPQLLQFSGLPAFRPDNPEGLVNILEVSSIQSTILSIAIALAVGPKMDFTFARPSLKRLPVSSYVVFGLISFVVACIAWRGLYVVQPTLPFSRISALPLSQTGIPPYVMMAFQAPAFTILLSLRVDMHLMSRRPVSSANRIIDGIVLAAASLVLLASTFVVFVRNWAGLIHVDPSKIHTSLEQVTAPLVGQQMAQTLTHFGITEFAIAFAAVSFVIGYVIPAAACEAVERRLAVHRDGLPSLAPATQSARPPPRAPIAATPRQSAGV